MSDGQGGKKTAPQTTYNGSKETLASYEQTNVNKHQWHVAQMLEGNESSLTSTPMRLPRVSASSPGSQYRRLRFQLHCVLQ
eukprot:3708369-Amphidinium_carterae.1